MTIEQIKKELGLEVLKFTTTFIDKRELINWYQCNLKNDVIVTMKQDLAHKIENNKNIDCLSIKNCYNISRNNKDTFNTTIYNPNNTAQRKLIDSLKEMLCDFNKIKKENDENLTSLAEFIKQIAMRTSVDKAIIALCLIKQAYLEFYRTNYPKKEIETEEEILCVFRDFLYTDKILINKCIVVDNKISDERISLIDSVDSHIKNRINIYPEIIISEDVKNLVIKNPEVIKEHNSKKLNLLSQPIKPKEPQKPDFPSDVLFTNFIKIPFGLFFMFVWILLAVNIYLFIAVQALIFLLCTINFVDETKRYRTEISQYTKSLREFPNLYRQYSEEISDYENKREKVLKTIQLKNELLEDVDYYYKKRFSFIQDTNILKSFKPHIDYPNTNVGTSEKEFKTVLNKYFPTEIITDKVLRIFREWETNYIGNWYYNSPTGAEKPTYVPDFIFQHSKSSLVIDIEIDEPYTSNNPIHYLGNEHDIRRNEYFTENGWVVIRFSEEQVKNDPEGCCSEIASIIYYFTGDDSYLERLKDVKRVYTHRKWTEEDSKKLIKIKSREMEDAKIEELLDGNWHFVDELPDQKEVFHINFKKYYK